MRGCELFSAGTYADAGNSALQASPTWVGVPVIGDAAGNEKLFLTEKPSNLTCAASEDLTIGMSRDGMNGTYCGTVKGSYPEIT